MVQVKPGQNLPITVHLFDGATGKVVKAKIKKLDGTVLTTVTLTDIGDGTYTHNAYTMPAGLDFITAELKVYQIDGTTPSPDHTETSEDYGVVYPIIATGLSFQLECVQTGETLATVDALQTADVTIQLRILKDGNIPLDISGATELTVKTKKTDLTTLTKNFASGVSISDAKGGLALVTLLAADLAALTAEPTSLEVVLTLGGQKHGRILSGVLNVIASIL